MNRKYTATEFLNSISLIRSYFPNAGITTDIIASYPTETESDFNETIEFCNKAKFSDIHCFNYSPREGTKSANLKDLSPSVKKDRLDRLIKVKEELKMEFIESNLNKELSLVVEEFDGEYTIGYTENYIKVYVLGKISNGKYKVILKSIMREGAYAEIKR